MRRDERSLRATRAMCLLAILSLLASAATLQADETLKERRARIEQMDPARKAELLRAEEKFQSLTKAERERLKQLHNQIEAHAKSDELLEVMHDYCEWVATLSPIERAELRELAPADRIEKIRELRKEQARWKKLRPPGMRRPNWGERLRQFALGEQEGLRRWIDGYTARGAPELVQAQPEARREQLLAELKQAAGDPERRRSLFARMWILWQLSEPRERLDFGSETLEELREELSPGAREWIEPMPPEFGQHVLTNLIGAFVFLNSQKELGEYLQHKLKPDEWERLTNGPADHMRQQMWSLYLRSKWGDMVPERRPGWPGRPFRDRRDGPPDSRPGRGPGRPPPMPPKEPGEEPGPPGLRGPKR